MLAGHGIEAGLRKKLASPLPKRHGLDAARLRLPPDGHWKTVRDHLVERLTRVPAERIDAMFVEGRFHTADGPLPIDAPYAPETFVWFHRDLPDEVVIDTPIDVIHRDENLLVVHKPHFLSTIPRGQHVLQTAVVRLRREHGLPDLVPAHRLDRATAGVLVFVIRPEVRGKYQTLFAKRRVHKEYEAIAAHRPDLQFPRTVRSRIIKERSVIAAYEVPGEPNAQTRIELAEVHNGLGRYRLFPKTGRTHQLRVHMNSLGIPILGDRFYPAIDEFTPDDFSRPLQLLAKKIAFTDPLTGHEMQFKTPADLAAWTSYETWRND